MLFKQRIFVHPFTIWFTQPNQIQKFLKHYRNDIFWLGIFSIPFTWHDYHQSDWRNLNIVSCWWLFMEAFNNDFYFFLFPSSCWEVTNMKRGCHLPNSLICISIYRSKKIRKISKDIFHSWIGTKMNPAVLNKVYMLNQNCSQVLFRYERLR